MSVCGCPIVGTTEGWINVGACKIVGIWKYGGLTVGWLTVGGLTVGWNGRGGWMNSPDGINTGEAVVAGTGNEKKKICYFLKNKNVN